MATSRTERTVTSASAAKSVKYKTRDLVSTVTLPLDVADKQILCGIIFSAPWQVPQSGMGNTNVYLFQARSDLSAVTFASIREVAWAKVKITGMSFSNGSITITFDGPESRFIDCIYA